MSARCRKRTCLDASLDACPAFTPPCPAPMANRMAAGASTNRSARFICRKRKPPPEGFERRSGEVTTLGYGFGELIAKQYSRPAPPVETRFSWLQPRLGCVEFHDEFGPPVRSKWPSMAVPSPLLVQLLQVWSALSVNARPSGMEPVR